MSKAAELAALIGSQSEGLLTIADAD